MQYQRKQRNLKRISRLEAQANRKAKQAYAMQGSGSYVFRNTTGAVLELPKTSQDGKKVVGPDEEWQGDDYFFTMVRETHEAAFVREVEQTPAQEPVQENQMQNEKLILDQPERVTSEGTVETFVTPPKAKPINEANPAAGRSVQERERLMNDDGSDGVEIIL